MGEDLGGDFNSRGELKEIRSLFVLRSSRESLENVTASMTDGLLVAQALLARVYILAARINTPKATYVVNSERKSEFNV